MREDTTSLKIPKELSKTVNRRKDNKKKQRTNNDLQITAQTTEY